MELDVGHVVACTWNWISPECHGLANGCAESIQKIECPCFLGCERGNIPPTSRKWGELHRLVQWLDP